MARAATSDELTLYRTPGQWSKLRAAIFAPSTIYTARVNQAFSTYDQLLEITYDTGSGTLGNVKADMTLLVGSSAGAHDKGITRVRAIDGTKIYIGETSDIAWADNDYLTIVDDYGLWARHVLISSGVPYMDGGVAYSDQHAAPDPTPIMGSNRVLKLTGASVSTQFGGASSYVIGGLSSISAYAWSCATASGSSGTTTATPTFTFNTVGWHLVYLTVTAANGKTFFGVRYVYVWSEASPPPSAQINNMRQDVESGGWEFDLTLFDDADLSTVRDHARVILFAADYFGDTNQSIGPVAGSENVLVTGWIAKESINWNPEAGEVRFTGYTAQYWLGRIPSFPDGVEFTAATPAAWTEFQNLTVDKGLWHFLHWRTTATRVMDIFLTGDTKYTAEVSSLASNLWEQIREMGFLQVYARAGCNAHNQLYVEVHPQLVPAASRTWPTVMTITKPDWQGEISFDRVTMPECAVVSLSGVAVNESGVGAAYFSLSPGHTYPHYGSIDVQDKLLVASQAQANQLAGLYRGWRNNPYPEIPISLAADIRLIECFPRSKCAIAIASGDTPRGITYSGNLLPTAVSIVTDAETGYLHREVSFEAETFEDISTNGDIPGGRADVSIPPTPSLPPLPPFPIILPGTVEPSPNGATVVLIHDNTLGLCLTENFDAALPTWRTINAGLTLSQAQAVNFIGICKNGAVYVGFTREQTLGETSSFIARAPSLGATFVIQTFPTSPAVIFEAAINPLVSEALCVWAGAALGANPRHIYVGANGSYAQGANINNFGSGGDGPGCLSYGLGRWLLTRQDGFARINTDGSLHSTGSAVGGGPRHIRASTTGITFHGMSGDVTFEKGENNMTTMTTVNSTDGISIGNTLETNYGDVDATGMYLMTRGLGAGKRARSSDGGVTWAAIPNLIFSNTWCFRNAGSPDRWIAAAATIQSTINRGDNWTARTGNLTTLYAFPGVDMVRVITP